ncbi:MAG: phosphoglycolate/pyridoxal phosphate family phosphatase [Armatimonadota bacterium]
MLKEPQMYVFDLDGVIYRGDMPLPHASETLRELRHRNRKIFFFTNNATKSREDYRSKLERMGISAPLDEIMTSAYATSLYFKESDKLGGRVYVVGEAGLVREMESAGMEVVRNGDSAHIDFVVVGLDRQFTYDKLAKAQQAILGGAEFVATNTDSTFPIEDGVVIPGGGSIVSAVATASGVEPFVVGKPRTYALKKIIEIAESTPDRSVMVGDRLETDVLGGNRMGMPTVLITTGVSTRSDAENTSGDMRPSRVIDDLIELLDESETMR